MRVKSPFPMFMAAALAAALAAPAAAQSPGGSSKGPIDITADELEVQNAQCISIWRGNAEALQDQSRLRANVLTAHMAPKGKAAPAGGAGNPGSSCGDLQRMEATGAVYYVTPTQRVHGDAATWDATNNMLTVTGDVVAVQGQNVIRGNKMVYNTVTGQGNVVGSGKGLKGQRPRAVFYPKDSDSKSASSTTAKPKS